MVFIKFKLISNTYKNQYISRKESIPVDLEKVIGFRDTASAFSHSFVSFTEQTLGERLVDSESFARS